MRHWICRKGISGSALPLKVGADPTPAEWEALASMGFTKATEGQRYLKRVSCPVNGDFYEYHRIELLDANGCLVGSRSEDE